MGARVQEVVIDCADPAGLAGFWAQVLEARWASVDEGWAVVDADPILIAFQRVPEAKQSPKNRLHLDVRVDAAPEAVARAEALGARRTGQSELSTTGDGYVVLQDPEGNEFCFVVDEGGTWTSTMRAALDAAP
ncbi:VOC family protein [Actinotalea sp. K2]|uniref:VOC family protein n=1 Tax=Actinotalea sp. K2 TaxID=2939438 RepID=UPI002016C551|nr:VOC family protein [Actinotalea sp. K2]MCL3859645.1 VOC family protein [Actinotalea sp. K2]